MELMLETLQLLREKYQFYGYIHVKSIPGADEELIRRAGFYADRMSCNLELPTAEGLKKLAPNKNRRMILKPLRQVQQGILQNKEMCIRDSPLIVSAAAVLIIVAGVTAIIKRGIFRNFILAMRNQ